MASQVHNVHTPPNRRNLLKNPDAKNEFQHWEIIEDGGYEWSIEGVCKPHPDPNVENCFVTSYELCLKQQLINLEEEGYSPEFMDEIQPAIEISDWFAPRWDCGSEYWICVELLNHRRQPVHVFKPDHVIFPQWNNQEWNQMSHTFKDYGPGIRFVRFTHGGKDTQFWAGNYGIRVTHSSVEIIPYELAGQCRTVTHVDRTQDHFAVSEVCREWKSVDDSTAFWMERCRREGFEPYDTNRTPSNWKIFYSLCTNRRNLLKNPYAKDEFQHWEIIEDGGYEWSIEGVRKPHHDTNVENCFVTSYKLCLKQQLINLEEEGYSPEFMDEIQPAIEISDWFAPHFDCGSEYSICVELLNHRRQPVHVFKPDRVIFQRWNDQMSHTFKDYGPGIRFVRFTHGGKGTHFWAGNYGIRVTHSSVEIIPYKL